MVDSRLETLEIPKLIAEGKMSKDKLQSCVKKCKQLKSLKSILNLAKAEKIKSAVSKLKSATSFTKKLSQTAS